MNIYLTYAYIHTYASTHIQTHTYIGADIVDIYLYIHVYVYTHKSLKLWIHYFVLYPLFLTFSFFVFIIVIILFQFFSQPIFTSEYWPMNHPRVLTFPRYSGYHVRYTCARSSVRSRAKAKNTGFWRIFVYMSSWNSRWCYSDLDCSLHVGGWPSERHPNVWRHRDARGCLLLLNEQKIGRMPYSVIDITYLYCRVHI